MTSLTFLIVEDEPLNRQLLLTILQYLGHQAFEASNGVEALAFLEKTPDVDAVLLDLRMAPLDGFAVLARLRAQPQTRNLPVICVSANAHPEDLDRAKEAGAQGYVVKPFGRRKLIATLDHVLRAAGILAPGQSVDPS